MKAILLYNRQTPEERHMQDMQRELKAAEVEVELLDADSPGGIQFAESHDIMGRPAVAILRADGSPVQIWQGSLESLPPVNELAYLARQ